MIIVVVRTLEQSISITDFLNEEGLKGTVNSHSINLNGLSEILVPFESGWRVARVTSAHDSSKELQWDTALNVDWIRSMLIFLPV